MASQLPDGSKIKLIATDLDGTLLNDEGQVSEKTKEVVGKILKKYPHLHFVIATGRTRQATIYVREALNIINKPNTESITSNGCVIHDSNNKIIYKNTLPSEYILKFHDLMIANPKALYGYTYGDGFVVFDEIFAKKLREIIKENVTVMEEEEHINKVKSGEMADINKVSYMGFFAGQETMKKLEKLKEEYNLEKAQYDSIIVEYMPHGTNKGTGLAQLIKNLNISKDEVIAFGDGGNDIEFLQNAGWPIAMENARDVLKPFAKYIAKSNSEDGVADILERIFLKDEITN
ncbi:hypothetical protein BCR36DRAFT_342292 [Piromyces finnis]|uniref:Uncharacterized protein n=1 Tax=Piromyces finnis TaxID=1754191 RepID=A0A1Y1VM71_9FUNG|nr:hypothetical protein BCR36DRAFT_342292 [Piromyces finnis]|eukprot:ORX60024.1 hypothetical protein BCR36DRAFT_342292 [Piromyces finnis]